MHPLTPITEEQIQFAGRSRGRSVMALLARGKVRLNTQKITIQWRIVLLLFTASVSCFLVWCFCFVFAGAALY